MSGEGRVLWERGLTGEGLCGAQRSEQEQTQHPPHFAKGGPDLPAVPSLRGAKCDCWASEENQISSGRVFMIRSQARGKLLHTLIVLVIVNQQLVQIGRIDRRTELSDIVDLLHFGIPTNFFGNFPLSV